jgi:hypothetical protein
MGLTKYDVATIATLNGLDKDYQKLSAALQRDLFGFAAIGRKDVVFENDGQGTVRIASSACFGTDGNVKRLSYAEFAEYCNEKRRIEL